MASKNVTLRDNKNNVNVYPLTHTYNVFDNSGKNLDTIITEIKENGGKIDSISVNGTTQTITNKNVDINVPELYNTTGQSVKGTLTQKAITDTLNSYVPLKNTYNEFMFSEYESVWATQTPDHILGSASMITKEDGTLARTMNYLTQDYLVSMSSNSDSEDSYGIYATQSITPGAIGFTIYDGSTDYAKSILFNSSGITFDDKKVLFEGDINETEAGTYLTKAGNYLHVDKTTLFSDISKETATAITTAKNEIKDELLGEGAHEDLNTISELSNALQNNKNIITTLNQAITDKASATQVDALEDRIDALESTVETATNEDINALFV